LILYPQAEKAQEPAHVILHAHMRIVKVTDTIVLIKTNQKLCVPNRDISGHDYMASLCFQDSSRFFWYSHGESTSPHFSWLPGTY